ncbi:MAG: NDP-sugar synthase [Lachnospiraceae bacterium]
MKDTALVIMAAGLGSRFGGGIKQLAPVGPNGEIIMDYSIHDALEAGFNKIIFITRKDLEEVFKEVIGNRIEKVAPVEYVFQEIEDLPDGFTVPSGRKKPWGTGQAVLCCKDVVKEPFVVINADDYYGKEAFVKIHDYLVSERSASKALDFCMAGFILENTLSDNGTVSRGVCSVDAQKNLVDVLETHEIERKADGRILCERDGKAVELDPKSHVSMNMWGLTPEIFDILEERFVAFLSELNESDIKKEYLLPSIIDGLLKDGTAAVKVLETQDKWFGVTYAEDKQSVTEAFEKLIANGVYQSPLFG